MFNNALKQNIIHLLTGCNFCTNGTNYVSETPSLSLISRCYTTTANTQVNGITVATVEKHDSNIDSCFQLSKIKFMLILYKTLQSVNLR